MTISQTIISRVCNYRRYAKIIIVALGLAFIAPAMAFAVDQLTFASPEAGIGALIKAIKATEEPALRAIFRTQRQQAPEFGRCGCGYEGPRQVQWIFTMLFTN